MSEAQKLTYLENALTLKGRESEVFKAIQRLQTTTLTEVKEFTKLPHQTASSRISTLYSKGFIKIIGKSYSTTKRTESLYAVCSVEERTQRRKELKEHLTGLITDHAQALAVLGNTAPKTQEFLIKHLGKYKNQLKELAI